MEYQNIDDLMPGMSTNQPLTPEQKDAAISAPENVPQETSQPEIHSSYEEPAEVAETAEPEEKLTESSSVDEYGNEQEQPKPRMYTEDELNERINQSIRDRLSRGKHAGIENHQQAEQQVQGFQYDENNAESWQQQLESFVEQTYHKINQRQAQQQVQQREQEAQAQFQYKFTEGVRKFNDYTQVVDAAKISDPMLMATRGLADPAAFLYAASKRAPADLERISRMQDPYAQILEMGKLEERLKKAPALTKTPKPISKTKEDLSIPHQADKKESIEDMIAEANSRKLSLINSRRR